MKQNQTELSLLRDEAEDLQNKIREFVAIGETRSFNEEETLEYDECEAKLTELQNQIRTQERTTKGKELTGAKRSEVFGVPNIGRGKRKATKEDYLNADKCFLLNVPEHRHRIADDWKRSADILGKNWEGKTWDLLDATRNQSGDVDTKGQEFTESSIYRGFVEAKQAMGGLLSVANIQNFPTSERSRWATDNDTASVGAVQSAENAALSVSSDVLNDDLYITPKTYYSKTTKISVQLIQNGREDILAYYGRKMARRLLKKVNVDLTAKLLEDVHVTTQGLSNALTYQDIGDLTFSLDPDYVVGPKVNFMGTHTTKHYLWEAFADPTEGPTWGDALNQRPLSNLIGFNYATNQQMDSMDGADKIPLVFGDFDNFVVHTVGTPKLIRLNELYMENLAVGLMMYWEVGGAVLDAGTHPLVALETGVLSGDTY